MRLAAWCVVIGLLTGVTPVKAGEYEDAVALRDGGDFIQSLPVFLRLAEHGDARAQYVLALMHGSGQGVAVNLPEAHRWALLAQANGNTEAGALLLSIQKRMPADMLAQAQERARLQAGKPQSGRRMNIRIRPGGASDAPAEKTAFATTRDALLHALDAWRAAESQRDINAYLAAYAPDLKLPKGLPRSLWESQRRERMRKGALNVTKTTEPVVTMAADGSATVQFTQLFQSRTYRETVDKTVVFGNYSGQWLIREETGKRRGKSQGL